MDTPVYEKILRNWHVKVQTVSEDTNGDHSPGQTALGYTVQDINKVCLILEKIPEHTYSRNHSIATVLEQFEHRGCTQIQPYLRNSLGQFITCYSGALYMLRRSAEGIPMPKDWLNEKWRADALADFIINLRKTAAGASIEDAGEDFSIIHFIKQYTETFDRHRPEISESLARVHHLIEAFLFPKLDALPTAFCHGNFQPHAVVWGEDSIRSITHWDLCGVKPEAYDAAMLVGSIGFRNPEALLSDFTKRFISRLRDASIFTDETWMVFFELTLSTRYIWLSEWMHRHDEKNRDLEILYMNLLATQKKYILNQWAIT